MKTSEVLDLAADEIESRGWTRGTGWNFDDHAPLCLEGGIMAAMGIRLPKEADWGNSVLESLATCPAYKAVADYLNYDKHLWMWNDDLVIFSTTPAQQVVETLRAAAAVERAREAVDTPLSV
jgi:hypothetical protein